jgi:AcrR family transcriptional regulator
MAVDGSRREAILEAMIRVVGEKGYASTSVADVLTEAGSSRATFYKHFDDKLDCFLAALQVAAERILGAATGACDGEQGWQERARAGLAAVVELFAANPGLARATLVEAATAGAEALQRYWTTAGRLAQLLEDHGQAPNQAELPSSTGLMAVAAVAGLVFDELKEGTAARLPRLLPELEFALLVPYLGPRAAADACGPPVASTSR